MPEILPNENLVELLVNGIFVNNFLLVYFLGLCSFLGLTKDSGSSAGMSLAVTFVMGMATVITWPIYYYILKPNGLGFLQTISFILVIAAFVQLVEFIVRKHVPSLYRSLGIYLPLITTNCAILGVVLLNIKADYSYVGSIVYAVAAGLGFGFIMIVTAGIRERLQLKGINLFKEFAGGFFVAAVLALIIVNYSSVIKF